jgi:hypothetical protein
MELEEGKSKYASVLDLVARRGVQLTIYNVQDDRLVITGNAPSQDIIP